MDRQKALEKIKKCLRLAASSNPNEAAAAMRQARAMMEKYRIEDADVLITDVIESSARSGAKTRPVAWEAGLAEVVGKAYCCSFLFLSGRGEYRFIGEMAEVASYTMTILLRQIRQARRDYIADHLARCKASTKTKRADVFCNAWVWKVRSSVWAFAGSEEPSAAAATYMAKHYPELSSFRPVDRSGDKKRMSQRDYQDAARGIKAAEGVQLNHGVDGQAPLALH
jgi:hypothetical protein